MTQKTAPNKTRIPKQQRSIEKKNRIMDAAMTLVAKKGIHNTNSKEIAAKAGVAIGTFYSYFPNKNQLLVELLDIYLKDHFHRIWKDGISTDATSFQQTIRHLAQNLLDAYDVAPDFHKETHVLRYSDPEVKALYDRDTEMEIKQISHVLEQFSVYHTIKNIKAAALVIQSAAENLVHKIKFMGIKDEKPAIDEFSEMIYKYLFKK